MRIMASRAFVTMFGGQISLAVGCDYYASTMMGVLP